MRKTRSEVLPASVTAPGARKLRHSLPPTSDEQNALLLSQADAVGFARGRPNPSFEGRTALYLRSFPEVPGGHPLTATCRRPSV